MESKANIEYNDDELEPPTWLNAQLFTEVLSSYEKAPELKVNDIKISPASAKGDHYASVMFRGIIDYTTQKGTFSKALICKTMPEQEGHKKEMLGNSYVFETEIGMYSKILPKFEEILRKAGDETTLCVPCLYYSLEPQKLLIFEDLVPQGYSVIRDRDVSMDELKAAYSKLAKWHAVSLYVQQEQPDSLKEFKHGMFSMPNIIDDPFVKDGMRQFLKFLESVPELTKYIPYFKSIESTYLEQTRKTLEEYRENRQANCYYVLSHGDYHARNMLFKHRNGNLEDCMLVDFQISNMCPITMDLIYSIYMLMGPNDRHNNYKELINFYFSVFVKTLQKIDYKGELPKLDELWAQMGRHKEYDLFLFSTFFPLICAMRTNASALTAAITNEEVRQKLYFSKDFIEEAKIILPRFEKLGYLK
ncbi:CG31300 [Drosophila busckii]|uniref:CG31300 n=1 Tax=Drosophila busckii TaxID=30019 RepID=A0A0M4F5H4_DROBS|nr:uncharacterized protein LOC117134622 [Drosophila busckii]ALC47125.1 CG31300 [Drosophila busckii]